MEEISKELQEKHRKEAVIKRQKIKDLKAKSLLEKQIGKLILDENPELLGIDRDEALQLVRELFYR